MGKPTGETTNSGWSLGNPQNGVCPVGLPFTIQNRGTPTRSSPETNRFFKGHGRLHHLASWGPKVAGFFGLGGRRGDSLTPAKTKNTHTHCPTCCGSKAVLQMKRPQHGAMSFGFPLKQPNNRHPQQSHNPTCSPCASEGGWSAQRLRKKRTDRRGAKKAQVAYRPGSFLG